MHEPAVFLGQVLCQLRDRRAAGGELVLRYQDVDAVRLAVDVVVDPGELHLERLRREARAAEDTETTCAAHRGDHVATVTEGEQREVDTDEVAHDVHAGQYPCRSCHRVDESRHLAAPRYVGCG